MNEANTLTRRQVLKLAATGVALAGAGMIEAGCDKSAGKPQASPAPVAPPPPPPTPGPTGWFDVKAFGAKGDGATPDEGAINAALQAAREARGGVIWFPPGLYLIESQVVVEHQVTLMGAGWDGGGHPSAGSWIMTKTPGVNVEIRGRGTLVQGIGFSQSQPSHSHDSKEDWTPTNHDFAIVVAADDVFLKQIHLLPCTRGIKIMSAGRAILDHIFGQPLTTGIEIDNAKDVVKVNNVHFWGFWSGDHPVRAWMSKNGTGLNCLRVDNPQFSNLFFLGYNRGIAFGASAHGITSKFKITNADCDSCETGIEVGGENTTGDVVNFSCQGSPGNIGISIVSPGIKVFLSHTRITNYRQNALRAVGNATRIFVDNLWAQGWNKANTGAPGVAAADGATVYLGRPLYFEDGGGAPVWQGTNGGQVMTGYDQMICAPG
ncbi:MAG TPA: glycosyl hydrolase family 28-related protein [Verrucomicrobiae bacterium]|jgi:hypothetical protein